MKNLIMALSAVLMVSGNQALADSNEGGWDHLQVLSCTTNPENIQGETISFALDLVHGGVGRKDYRLRVAHTVTDFSKSWEPKVLASESGEALLVEADLNRQMTTATSTGNVQLKISLAEIALGSTRIPGVGTIAGKSIQVSCQVPQIDNLRAYLKAAGR